MCRQDEFIQFFKCINLSRCDLEGARAQKQKTKEALQKVQGRKMLISVLVSPVSSCHIYLLRCANQGDDIFSGQHEGSAIN